MSYKWDPASLYIFIVETWDHFLYILSHVTSFRYKYETCNTITITQFASDHNRRVGAGLGGLGAAVWWKGNRCSGEGLVVAGHVAIIGRSRCGQVKNWDPSFSCIILVIDFNVSLIHSIQYNVLFFFFSYLIFPLVYFFSHSAIFTSWELITWIILNVRTCSEWTLCQLRDGDIWRKRKRRKRKGGT